MNKGVTEYGPHNQGLFVLYPPHPKWEKEHGPPTLDVVAVHGLNGDCRRTWTHVDPKTKKETLWLKDMLPHKMPYVRPMTFGYHASILANTSESGVRDNARSLLMELRNRRERDGSKARPIVFIGHSLGGIIIKQALCTANMYKDQFGDILSSTRGLVFFGTPHRGTDVAVWGEMVARIKVASYGRMGLSDYFRVLRPNQKDLMDISEDFRPLATRFAISSFNEDNPYPGMYKVVVEKKSAILEMTHEEFQVMPGDHSTIVKFSPSDEDQNRFDRAWQAIERVSKGPATTTTFEYRAVFSETPETSRRSVRGRRRPVEIDARIEAPRGFGMHQIEYPTKEYMGQNAWGMGREQDKITTKDERWEQGTWYNKGW